MNFRIACILAFLGSTALPGQDVLKIAPAGTVKVEYEDNQIRVLRFKEPPGTRFAMHSHGPYAGVSLRDDVSQYSFPDGKTAEQKSKAGEAEFSKAVIHASENTGSTVAETIMVEFKTEPAGTVLTGDGDMVAGNPTMCTAELDNPYARITRVKIPAHGKLAMHSHASRTVVVYLTGGKARTIAADGEAKEAMIAAGTVVANPAGRHANENLGDQPTEAVVIELKTAAT